MDIKQQKYTENLLRDAREKTSAEVFKYINERTEEISDKEVREEVKQYVIFHLKFRNLADAVPKNFLILLHGIRTYAVWQDLVKDRFSGEDVEVVIIKYGWFNLLTFSLPFLWRGALKKILGHVRRIQSNNLGSNINIISHSFGTYLTCELLKEADDIKINSIILCGSIMPGDFEWNRLPGTFPENRILNDVGTKDFLPVFAKLLIHKNYGNSGTFGFESPMIEDRYHDFGHGGFFNKEFIDEYWKPFILRNDVVASKWNHERPMPNKFITLVDNLWYCLIVIAVLAILLFYLF